MLMKDRFIKLLRSVDRVGIDNLAGYLVHETDFFTAPASSQYHGAYEGGLVEHSLTVFENLSKKKETVLSECDFNSITLVSLLHDICKANFYKVDYRNKKNEYGNWEKVPYYAIDDQFPAGHGEKSVMIVQQFIKLKPEEALAINWHMAGFDERSKGYGGMQALSAAMSKYNLVAALHIADLEACYFDKK